MKRLLFILMTTLFVAATLQASPAAAATHTPPEMDFSEFSPAKLQESGGKVRVTFQNTKTGRLHNYVFTADYTHKPDRKTISPAATQTRTGTILNRTETKQFAGDSQKKAMIYTIATLLGVKPAALGTLIYSQWSYYAGEYYKRGGCIKINYWYTVNFVKLGDRGCF